MEAVDSKIEQLLRRQETGPNSTKITITFPQKVMIILGPSGSGKTYLLNELYKRSGHSAEDTYYISPTFHNQKPEVQHTFRNANIITTGWAEANYDTVENDKLLIFDDIGSGLKSNASFERLIINKRHRNLTVIMMIQYIKFVGPTIRDNWEYLFCFRFSSFRAYSSIYDDYMNRYFERKQEFISYMKSMRGHTFILATRDSCTLTTID